MLFYIAIFGDRALAPDIMMLHEEACKTRGLQDREYRKAV